MPPFAPRNPTEHMLSVMLGDVSEIVASLTEKRELPTSVRANTLLPPSPADPAVSIESTQVPSGEPFPRGVRWMPDYYDADGFRHMTVHDSAHELVVEIAVRPELADQRFEQFWTEWLNRVDPIHAVVRLA